MEMKLLLLLVAAVNAQSVLQPFTVKWPIQNLPFPKKPATWEASANGNVKMILPFSESATDTASDSVSDFMKWWNPESVDFKTQLQQQGHDSLLLRPENTKYWTSLQQDFAAKNNINVQWQALPSDANYTWFIDQVKAACKQKQTIQYDIMWLDSTAIGHLGDCLVDAFDYQSTMGQGHDPNIIINNIYNGSLVALPIESNLGLMYQNQDIINKYYPGKNIPFTNIQEFETIIQHILTQERAFDNLGITGYSSPLKKQDLMAWLVEMLATTNSTIFNKYLNASSLAVNETASLFSRLASWSEVGIIDLTKTSQMDVNFAINKFVDAKSVFLRYWSTSMYDLNNQTTFTMTVAPIGLTASSTTSYSVYNGWSLGVYKYSNNQDAAMKLVKYLTSLQVQKKMATEAPQPVLPTYPSLFSDSDVCTKLTVDYCNVFKSITVLQRPSTFAGLKYEGLTSLVEYSIVRILDGTDKIVDGLKTLDRKISDLMGFSLKQNQTINIDDSASANIKKLPSNVYTQFTILVGIIFCSVASIAGWKRYSTSSFERIPDIEKGAVVEMAQIEKTKINI